MSSTKKMIECLTSLLIMIFHTIVVFRDWAFRRGTDTMQIFNIAICGFFFYVFTINSAQIKGLPIYKAFDSFHDTFWWYAMGLLGVFQFIFLFIRSVRFNVFSGFNLIVTAPFYIFIAIKLSGAGFINTGSLFYTFFGFMCLMAGWRMMDENDCKIVSKSAVKNKADTHKVGDDNVAKLNDGIELATNTASTDSDVRRFIDGIDDSTAKS